MSDLVSSSKQILIEGFYSPQGSSERKKATISHQHNQTFLLADKDSFYLESSQLSASSRIGKSARFVEISDVGLFETRDNDGVDALLRQIHPSALSSLLHGLESNLSWIAAALVFTVLFTWGMVKYGIPALTETIVSSLPANTGLVLEETLLDELKDSLFSDSELDEQRIKELNDLFLEVASNMNVNQDSVTFSIKRGRSSIGANALAFPGGTIIMTDQLIELTKSDDQIAGVMAHEIAHINEQHSLKQLVRGSIISFAAAMIIGDVSSTSATILAAPSLLLELNYSRQFEIEADRAAAEYLGCNKAALDSMGEFFLAMEKDSERYVEQTYIEESSPEQSEKEKSTVGDFLSTHPSSHNREEFFSAFYKNNCE